MGPLFLKENLWVPPLVQFGIRKVAASRRPSTNIVAIFSTSLVIYAQSYCLQWPTFIKVEHDIISSKRKVCRRGNIRNDEDRSARHKFIKKSILRCTMKVRREREDAFTNDFFTVSLSLQQYHSTTSVCMDTVVQMILACY